MSLSPVVLWLAEAIGKRKLNELLDGRDKAEGRILRRALADSQNQRDELAGVAEMFAEIFDPRDALQATVIRLELENSGLRAEIAMLKAAANP
jgi:hypothetical protein